MKFERGGITYYDDLAFGANMKFERGGVTLYGQLAEVASQMTEEDWMLSEVIDTLSDAIAQAMQDHDITDKQLAEELCKMGWNVDADYVRKMVGGYDEVFASITLAQIIKTAVAFKNITGEE